MLPIVAISEQKRRGAWYTPAPLVAFLCDHVVEPAIEEAADPAALRILDPACGDGRVLAAVLERLAPRIGLDAARRCLLGVELDPAAAAGAEERLGLGPGAIRAGDARRLLRGLAPVDVVVGNPPYLSQLSRATSRGGRSSLGGGPYADVAVEFLSLAAGLVRPDGGRVGLVLPQSVLGSRDAGPVRSALLQEGAAVETCWWAGVPVFDAAVHTVILGLVRGRAVPSVRRWSGPEMRRAPDAPPLSPEEATWGRLVHDLAGVPTVVLAAGTGRLGDLGDVGAGFRQHFYGLAPFVRDGGDGAPLVTSGMIDPGVVRWGERPARFAGRRWQRPTVVLDALAAGGSPALVGWARRQLVPKVLVATQTRVLEAVADPGGRWLPSVPVVTVRTPDPWAVAAVITAPPVAAWAACRQAGTGLSPGTLRVSAGLVRELPLPADRSRWDAGAACLRAGDVPGCAEAMSAAYGVADAAVLAWWRAAAPGSGVE